MEDRRDSARADQIDQQENPRAITEEVRRSFRVLPDNALTTPGRDSSGQEVPPPPRICQFCQAEKEWKVVEVLPGRVRYIPWPCRCDGEREYESQIAAEKRIAEKESTLGMLLHRAGIDEGRWKRMSLSTWEVDRNPPHTQEGFDTIRFYLESVEREGRNWLYLCGPYGTGKTHLAVAAMRELIHSKMWTGCAVVWPEHCAAVQESWGRDGGEREYQLWDRMRNNILLLIDDLDKRVPSPWALGKLYEVLEFRYRYEKPTIITANRSISELGTQWGNINLGRGKEGQAQQIQDSGAAVLSRIAGQLWGGIEMQGVDQRWWDK